MPLAPNTLNYYIGKGNVYFKKIGASDYRHVGNVPQFEFTPSVDTLDHFSSMEGTKTKDKTAILTKGGNVRMVMEEWVAENLALLLMADDVDTVLASTAEDAHLSIEILASNAVSGALKFVGNNDIGPKWTFEFAQVDFIPGSSINPISDEWGQIEVNGQLVSVNGSFGTAKVYGEEEATP